jgi:hypothetical protein
VLGVLSAVAREYQLGLVLIHHLRKRALPMFDLVTPDDFRGSSHIMAMARSVMGLSVIKTTEELDRNGPRRLEVVKTNLTSYPKALGVNFQAVEGGVWLRYDEKAPRAYREPTQAEECAAWLVAVLEEAGGPVKPKDIIDLAQADGYSRDVLYRARKALGEQITDTATKRDPGNMWSLAEE